MTRRETFRAVRKRITEGKSKQETFDSLNEMSQITDEELATLIKRVPSLTMRDKYKMLNLVLIILLSLTVLFKILAAIPIIVEKGINWFPVVLIFPLLNLFLLWGVITFYPGIHRLVGMLTIIGLLQSLRQLSGISFDPLVVFDLAIAAGLIGLGFFLNAKLCPDYQIIKESYQNEDGEERLRNVIRFDE